MYFRGQVLMSTSEDPARFEAISRLARLCPERVLIQELWMGFPHLSDGKQDKKLWQNPK
jgi:hypothetical protein